MIAYFLEGPKRCLPIFNTRGTVWFRGATDTCFYNRGTIGKRGTVGNRRMFLNRGTIGLTKVYKVPLLSSPTVYSNLEAHTAHSSIYSFHHYVAPLWLL